MKITHIIFSLKIGGSESMLVDIINEQVKTNTVCLIIVNNIINKHLISSIDNRITVHFINRKENSKNPIPILKLNYVLFKIKSDIIHCHNYKMILLISPIIKSKIFLTVHSLNAPTIYHRKYDAVYAISNAVKQDIKQHININPTVIYNGIHFNKIEIKRDYTFKTFKIVQIGRLDHNKKGQHVLLQALSIIFHKTNIKNIHIDFIGEGISYNFLQNLVKELKLFDSVSFLGLKDREYIYKNLKNYDLLIQPSIFEGFGLTVVESMAAKVPVLVSDIQGPMEVINNGKYGFCFDAGKPEKLAHKIKEIIFLYKTNKIQSMAEKSWEYSQNKFDIKNTAKNYIIEYKKQTNPIYGNKTHSIY